jgi:hypothetical protein
MRPTFHHHALINHIDDIRLLDRAKSVRNSNRCPPPRRGIQRGLDDLLGLGVQGAGGFVEEEDLGVAEESAGDGETLFLAAGEEGRFAAYGSGKSVTMKFFMLAWHSEWGWNEARAAMPRLTGVTL